MFAYPPQAQVNRALPKSKIYGFAKPGRAVRDRFVALVSDITWKYKLSPETLNLPPKEPVQEIQIFEIALKTGKVSPRFSEHILRTMDKAMPSRLFFEIRFGGQVRFAATYKRPSEADSRKSVVDVYFETPWQSTDAPRPPLPVVLDMATLYEAMLHEHMRESPLALTPRAGEDLEAMVERANQVRAKEKECRRLEVRLKREIQFNRKVELNAALRGRRAELAQLQQQ